MPTYHTHKWSPIHDLPSDWADLVDPQLGPLVATWREQETKLQGSDLYQEFLGRLRRQWAIETGILERLYTLSEGVTRTLIEQGLDAALISHEDTDRAPDVVKAMIRDQHQAIEGLYQFVAAKRSLSKSYLWEMHQVITANQQYCEAIDSLGRRTQVLLIKGDWKKLTNNIDFGDGSGFEFCPPEQLESELEQLMCWHGEHAGGTVPCEVEAAWLHHRFTLIHPFQDGNGRIARCLATLVMLRDGRFPLVITRDDRATYLTALRHADDGNLGPLVALFGFLQRRAILQALDLSEELQKTTSSIKEVLGSAARIVTARKQETQHRHENVVALATALQVIAGQRLQYWAAQVDPIVKQVDPHFGAYAKDAAANDANAAHYRYQIGQCAKTHGYFANFSTHQAWAGLFIRMDTRTEMIFSFHGVGRNSPGVLACSGMAYVVDAVEGAEHGSKLGAVNPLSAQPFIFTQNDNSTTVPSAYETWLESCVKSGLDFWKQQI